MIPLWLHFGTKMANLTIKNIPDDLYQRLKKRAEVNRRSMNAEVLVCLEETLITPQVDTTTILSRIRELRAKTTRHLLADEEILKIKNEGRS
jgi:antitoxin FitA